MNDRLCEQHPDAGREGQLRRDHDRVQLLHDLQAEDYAVAGATKLWETPLLASGVCSPIIHDGLVYGAGRALRRLRDRQDNLAGRKRRHGGFVHPHV